MDGRISGRALDAELERRRRLRRRVVPLLLGAVFLAGTAAALFGEYGYLDLRRSRRELAEAEQRLQERVDRVRRLRLEVRELRHGTSGVERMAREELGFIRDGEVTFLLPVTDEPFPPEPAERDDVPTSPDAGGSERP